jgi:hypothetical protein
MKKINRTNLLVTINLVLIGLISIFGISYSAGWHTAEEILGGEFKGSEYNFSSNSNINFLGNSIKKVWYSTGNSQESRSGYLSDRILTFNKSYSNSIIKITYVDNFQVNGDNNLCDWEIKVDNASCSNKIISTMNSMGELYAPMSI